MKLETTGIRERKQQQLLNDGLESADLILYNGLFLEAKMTEILEKMSRGKHVVAVSEEIPDSLLLKAQSKLAPVREMKSLVYLEGSGGKISALEKVEDHGAINLNAARGM